MTDKQNGIAQLARVSGLSQVDIAKIAEQVRENHRKLDHCPGACHHFEQIEGATPLRTRYRCNDCGGEIDGVAQKWYQTGLDHGRRSSDS